MTHRSTLSIPERVEETTEAMLTYLVDMETDVVAFLYRAGHRPDEELLEAGPEHVDDDLADKSVQLVKCSER